MSSRIKIMGVVFVGLHLPLMALAAAATVLDIPQAPVILGIALGATLVAVAATLCLLHLMLPPDQTPRITTA